ncbi:MAG: hypothetical protein HWN81_04510 [Candidatus Lokiarchaeota archaeon]|nr:hypothetical protein [Candidatus Lokiarchaeota archaeon]
MRKDVITIKNNLSEGISTLQKDFKFSIKEKLNELDMYIDDKFEVFDSHQEYLKELFNNIKTELDNQFKLLIKQRIDDSFDPPLRQFNEQLEILTKTNLQSLESSKSLSQQITILESLSRNVNSIGELTTDKLDKNIGELSENFTKNTNKIIGNFINLNKDTKTFLSNLKAAIILLESSKTPLQNKLNAQETEIKTLQKNLIELKKDNQDLLNKIEKLQKKEE